MAKYSLLAWCDSPTAATGFGTVAKYVIAALNATNLFDIDQLAINYYGEFVDRKQIPWQLVSTKIQDPSDPLGLKMFLRSVADKQYDFIWIMNDLYVTDIVAKDLMNILDQQYKKNKKKTVVIYYYPVDCRVPPLESNMVLNADFPVAYNEWSKQETVNSLSIDPNKIKVITHGVDTQIFYPYSREICEDLKEKLFKVSRDTFVVINVNRNSPRKQLTRTMLAFKKFKEQVPNSILYLHTKIQESNIDLSIAAKHLGLKGQEDIIFPPNYFPGHGYPVDILNQLYNASDLFLTTHLGEGDGLGQREALAAGLPVIAPNITSSFEMLPPERGFTYEPTDLLFLENSGYRPVGHTDDIVAKMLEVNSLGFKHQIPQVKKAQKWSFENTWGHKCQQWIDLILEAVAFKDACEKNDPTIQGMIL